jgi:hypothetical protein
VLRICSVTVAEVPASIRTSVGSRTALGGMLRP